MDRVANAPLRLSPVLRNVHRSNDVQAVAPRDITEWLPTIQRVARSVSFDFPGVERDEIQSELTVFVLSQSRLTSPDQVGAVSCLYRKAKQYAFSVRAGHLGITCQYAYRPSDVRRILETVFDHDKWEQAFVPDDAVSMKGNDGVELSADLSWAIGMLPEDYRVVLVSRYRDGARISGDGGESAKCSRAVRKLCDILNSYDRGGGRVW